MQDIYKVEGFIRCIVDSVSNEEISIILSNLKETILYGLILDLEGSIENSILTGGKTIKLDFIIPNTRDFNVCHYCLNQLKTPPILGSYQRKKLSEDLYRIRIKLSVDKPQKKFVKNVKIQLRLNPS